jgi:hypothetical protein
VNDEPGRAVLVGWSRGRLGTAGGFHVAMAVASTADSTGGKAGEVAVARYQHV